MVYIIGCYVMGVEDYTSTDKIKETENNVTVGSTEFSENLNNFLNDITENQDEIISILESQENQELKNRLENFLQTQNTEDKNKLNLLKFKLATCEPKDLAGIIAEYVGYKIGDFEAGESINLGEDIGGISLDDMNQTVTDVNQAQVDVNQAQVDVNQAQVDVNQAQVDVNQAQVDVNQAQVILDLVKDNKEKIERAMEIAKVARQELLAGRLDVDEKTREKAELAKQQLPEETKQQLKEKGYDENFINDYILLRVTVNEVKNDSSFDKNAVAQFESKVNELSTLDVILKSIDNACNIPDTSLSSFSTENIAQTRTELFNEDIGNESLIQARKNNIESHAEAYAEIFLEMGTDEVIAKYGKFLQGDLKEFWQQYESNRDAIKNKIAEIGIMIKNQQIFSENGKNYISDEEKLLFDNYKKMLSVTSEIKKDIENRTKNMMEEMCLISQIKGMSMCIGQEEGKDFNLNKAKEIESENGIYSISKRFNKSLSFFSSHSFLSNKAL